MADSTVTSAPLKSLTTAEILDQQWGKQVPWMNKFLWRPCNDDWRISEEHDQVIIAAPKLSTQVASNVRVDAVYIGYCPDSLEGQLEVLRSAPQPDNYAFNNLGLFQADVSPRGITINYLAYKLQLAMHDPSADEQLRHIIDTPHGLFSLSSVYTKTGTERALTAYHNKYRCMSVSDICHDLTKLITIRVKCTKEEVTTRTRKSRFYRITLVFASQS